MTLSTRAEAAGEAPERAAAAAPPAREAVAEPAVETAPVSANAALHRMVSGRAPQHAAGFGALSGGGNQAIARLARPVQPKLTVSRPGDPLERQADAAAAQITAGEPVAGQAAPAISRLVLPAAAAGEPPGDPQQTPPGLEQLIASPGSGAPIPPEVRDRIEAHLGTGLVGVQVHGDPAARQAAAQLGARAFTTGRHIFLGPGESAADLALMAHEATHVVQQQSIGVFRVHRDATDFLMGPLRELVRAVPGYDMLTVVAGYDPIANRTVDRGPENLTRGVLGLVPFGNVVAGKLIELGVVQGAAKMLDEGLAARNLTLARIQGEIDQAWKEIDFTDPDGALDIVKRHVSSLYADALAFAKGIVDAVVQLIRDAAVGLAEKYLVGTPTWELVKKVLHHDPLRGTPVEATTVQILTDFLTLIGKQDALKQMQERGTLQKTADWLDTRIAQFLGLLGELTALFQSGWQAIEPENLASLPDNLSKLAEQAKGLIGRIGTFAGDVLTEVVRLIKDALLEWLSREAAEMRGFRLMTVLLGADPFTGKAVARTAENLIGGFIALLPGGEATYRKLAEAGVIADAAAQIEGAITRLGITPDLIIGTFRTIWNSLTLEDLVNPLGAFRRILDRFGEPLGRIVEFAGEVLQVVITLILKLMNFPSELLGSIISNAMAAIEDIKKDPVAFLLNMLQALKHGFIGFIDNALTYLLTGLADWMFRGLGALGVQKPPDLSFGSILTLVLQVLDITTEKLWQKLGDQIGPETVDKIRKGLDVADGAFDFIKDVQEGGVGAIWKHVESQLGNLWDTVLGMVKDWIVREIVEKATVKLLSMLDPTGIMAVVNSSIAFFKAVQSVIEYVRELLTIINDYVTTLAAVAAGNIGAGAQKVEKGLASAVPVAIGFLANQVGLGAVPEKLVEIIGQVRLFVDQALDWLFKKAMDLGRAALNALGLGGKDKPAEPDPDAGDPADKTWIAEWPESGHTIKLASDFTVFQFSTPTALAGDAREKARQKALADLIGAPLTVDYGTSAHATGVTGYTDRVKKGDKRMEMPKVDTLPGGRNAYEAGDARGHLFGDRFWGSAIAQNLVPMHSTLNLSAFKSFENQVASKYEEVKAQGRGGVVWLDLKPNYPGPDPSAPGKEFRPTSVEAEGKVFSLDVASGHTALHTDAFARQTLPNPSRGVTELDLNTAQHGEILALFEGSLGPDVHAVVNAIMTSRPASNVDALLLRINEKLSDPLRERFAPIWNSRAAQFDLVWPVKKPG